MPLRPANHHIVQPITVHISYRDRRPVLRKFVGQHLLNIEVDIVPLLLPEMKTDRIRDIAEQRPRRDRRLHYGIRQPRIPVIRHQPLIGRDPQPFLHLPVRPFDQHRIDHRNFPKPEMGNILDRRQITTVWRILIDLLLTASIMQLNPGPESSLVQRVALETDLQIMLTIRIMLPGHIPVDMRLVIDIVDDKIEIAIPIQIRICGAIRKPRRHQTPFLRHIGES